MEMLIIATVVVLAFAAVLIPLMRRRTAVDDDREFGGSAATPAPAAPPRDTIADDELELEIERYRAAVRAGTVCAKCGQANPADSLFCFECGARLPLADAKEFE